MEKVPGTFFHPTIGSEPPPSNSCTPKLANMLHCAKVPSMRQTDVHIGFTGAHDRALMSEVFAMQCMNASAGLLAENPMSRRNDAYSAIFYFRYC